MRDLKEILQISQDDNVTGYQLQRDLDINQIGAGKIINAKSKNPRKTTLKMLNSYIDNNFKPLENTKTSEVPNSKEPDAIWVEFNRFKKKHQ